MRAKICEYCGQQFFVTSKKPGKRFCNKSCAASSQGRLFDPPADELRQLVWSLPTSTIAKQFGVSDHTVEKRCIEHGIPKPAPGYWAQRVVGKIDRDGNQTIPLISCACGCGKMVPKWSGKRLRLRRCVVGHCVSYNGGGRPGMHSGACGRRTIDINVTAIRDATREGIGEIEAMAAALTGDITYKHFCDYLGPVYLAVREQWESGVRCFNDLRPIAKMAVKNYWTQTRGHWGTISIDAVREEHGRELAVVKPERNGPCEYRDLKPAVSLKNASVEKYSAAARFVRRTAERMRAVALRTESKSQDTSSIGVNS